MKATSVLIERLRLELAVAAADERARLVERRVRDAVKRRFHPAGRTGASAEDRPVVFIDRLRCDCAVSTAWDDDAIGDAVARGLAAALERAPQQAGGVVFRDRAELLAALLAALGEGSAWGRWWFEEFEGLKPLGASAAVRTAVIDAGEAGIAALARLTEGTASQVLRTLSGGDAARLLAFIGKRQQSAVAAAFGLWRLSERLAQETGNDASAWLRALIATERAWPGAAGPATTAVLRAMTRLRELAAEGAFDTGAAFAADTPFISLQAIAQRFDVPVEWLARMSEPEIAAVAADLAVLSGGAGQASSATPDALRAATRHGGAFVLIKVMHGLRWIERWQQAAAALLPQPQADALARVLALQVAAKALASRAARAVTSDPALVLALDTSAHAGMLRRHAAAARRALRSTGTPAAALLLDALAGRIAGLAGSSPAYLRENALALPAAVARDGMRVRVLLGRAPLDVLLALSGARRGSFTLPGGPEIELAEEAAA